MLTCPYCNAALDPVALAPAGGRPPCPRCGEMLPEGMLANLSAAPSEVAGWPAAPLMVEKPRAANRRTALWLLAMMGCMALLGLIYALATTNFRRQNDPKKIEIQGVVATQPLELTGLGYLPANVNMVAGINVAGALANPSKKLTEAVALLSPPWPGLLDTGVNYLKRWTGLQLQDLDHVALGTRLTNELPQVTAVVVTKKPYDPKAVAQALHPARPTTHLGQPLFQFSVKPAGEALLWCPNDLTLVLILRVDAVKKQDLQSIPLKPALDAAQLSAPLHQLLEQRLNKQSLLFAAGQVDDLTVPGEMLALAGVPRRLLGPWTKLKQFTLGVAPIEGLTLEGQFFTGQAPAAQELQALLENMKLPEASSHKVIGPPPEEKNMDAQWVQWQVRGDAEMVRGWLDWAGAKK